MRKLGKYLEVRFVDVENKIKDFIHASLMIFGEKKIIYSGDYNKIL